MPSRPRPHPADQQIDEVRALEQPHDILHRLTAGHRAATLHKLLFDLAEAAVILGCSSNVLEAWRRTGQGPRWVMLDGRLVRYPLSGLVRYVEQLARDRESAA